MPLTHTPTYRISPTHIPSHIISRRLGNLSPSHMSTSTKNYAAIPPAPFSHIPRHKLTYSGTRTTLQLSNPSLFPCASVADYNDRQLSRSCSPAGTAHQHPSAAISALTDSQVNLTFDVCSWIFDDNVCCSHTRMSHMTSRRAPSDQTGTSLTTASVKARNIAYMTSSPRFQLLPLTMVTPRQRFSVT